MRRRCTTVSAMAIYVKIHVVCVWWNAFAPAKKLPFQSNQSLLFIFSFSFGCIGISVRIHGIGGSAWCDDDDGD